MNLRDLSLDSGLASHDIAVLVAQELSSLVLAHSVQTDVVAYKQSIIQNGGLTLVVHSLELLDEQSGSVFDVSRRNGVLAPHTDKRANETVSALLLVEDGGHLKALLAVWARDTQSSNRSF